jgi:hypothetical protein
MSATTYLALSLLRILDYRVPARVKFRVALAAICIDASIFIATMASLLLQALL